MTTPARPPEVPQAGPAPPILPGEVPVRPLSSAGAVTPAPAAAAEKSGVDKPPISAIKATGDDSPSAAANDQGEKKK